MVVAAVALDLSAEEEEGIVLVGFGWLLKTNMRLRTLRTISLVVASERARMPSLVVVECERVNELVSSILGEKEREKLKQTSAGAPW